MFCRNCQHQRFAPQRPETCPICGSSDIFFYSLNISTLANILRQIVPQANIRLISETSHQLPTTNYQLPTVDIATAAVFYAPAIYKYDLVAAIATDTLINAADFNAAERSFAQISDLKRQLKEDGTLILQTYNPESELIRNAALGNWLEFYQSQLEARKLLSYPPYSLMVKLAIKGKDHQKISQMAQDLVEKLKEKTPENLLILGPFQPYFSDRIGRYNIILKKRLESYSLSEREKAITSLSGTLAQVDTKWQIVVEPASLN